MKIVHVNAALPPMPEFVVKYAVLRDKTCREVLRAARQNPEVWIFVFATGTVEECHNYSYLKRVARRDTRYQYVMQPWWLGNFQDVEVAIRHFVELTFKGVSYEEVVL